MGQPPKASDALEQEISTIDRAEAAAVLATDVPALEQMWADDFTVNGPNNQILQGKHDALALVQAGLLNYASFERDVEAVLLDGHTAIVMGLETVQPQGNAPAAGQTVRRRFTNIWMQRNGRWQLRARQATIISRD